MAGTEMLVETVREGEMQGDRVNEMVEGGKDDG